VLQEPLSPIIVEVASAPPATEAITVVDVLMGALGFIGAIAGVAVALAVLLAGGLIVLRHRRASSPDGPESSATSLGLYSD
jgi:hypothetical protein